MALPTKRDRYAGGSAHGGTVQKTVNKKMVKWPWCNWRCASRKEPEASREVLGTRGRPAKGCLVARRAALVIVKASVMAGNAGYVVLGSSTKSGLRQAAVAVMVDDAAMARQTKRER